MSIQSDADWRGIGEAARVARLALDALSARVRAGVTTGELDVIAARLFRAQRARSARHRARCRNRHHATFVLIVAG